MATTFAQLLTRLDVKLRDGDNKTFSAAEKTDCLQTAVDSPMVSKSVRDTSLTTLANTYSYTIPTGISAIYKLGIDLDGTGRGSRIPREYWDEIDGQIQLRTPLPAGKSLIVVGKSKLTNATPDFPTYLHSYILELALAEAFELLKTSLTTRFLKNALTMSDVIQSITTHRRNAQELEKSIANQFLMDL